MVEELQSRRRVARAAASPRRPTRDPAPPKRRNPDRPAWTPNMPSDFLTAFLEVDPDLCENFVGPGLSEASACGLRRHRSLCPVAPPDSKFADTGPWAGWPRWRREGRLPRSLLSRIPFRTDRSVSVPADDEAPPGPYVADPTSGPAPPSPRVSARYKTELCRTFEESGVCKYGAKCQFAHGADELRGLSRHPKYKTEPCRTFHTVGFCPYGARCHFVHNAEELLEARAGPPPPPPLRHSLSFAGFSSVDDARPSPRRSPPLLALSSSASLSGSPELLSPPFPKPGLLRPFPNAFSAATELAGEKDFANDADFVLRFFAADDRADAGRPAPAPGRLPRRAPPETPAALLGPPGLRRCSSTDSLSEEGYASSCSLSSGCGGAESPGCEGRRLPIFSRLSATDE
ncbi:mRNA decay activator protein ZFP36L1-like [Phyllopteryx taeniolatus]|uniref:mRNA decay activator protein ZFP36L1-like n=1 Tax=Phyllopteryx taeniolatus TaxID=161469 RepID=UPI002AD29D48|nr:mRNA decay activator protein ZFP36L1-like [Phyllopteryx taeniolatus]